MNRQRIWTACCIMALCAWSRGNAEETVWHKGSTIDCPVTLSVDGQERIRAIELPCQRVVEVRLPRNDMSWIRVDRRANQVLIRLNADAADTTVSVWDENNELYSLLVRPPANGEMPDDHLIVHGGENAKSEEGPTVNQDTDAAISNLMGQMVGGVTDPDIHWSNQQTVGRGGVITPGRVEYERDHIKITVLRVYRAPPLFGYEVLFEMTGDEDRRINIQNLWRNGILAVASPDQPALSRKNPTLWVGGRKAIHVFYVTDLEVK